MARLRDGKDCAPSGSKGHEDLAGVTTVQSTKPQTSILNRFNKNESIVGFFSQLLCSDGKNLTEVIVASTGQRERRFIPSANIVMEIRWSGCGLIPSIDNGLIWYRPCSF